MQAVGKNRQAKWWPPDLREDIFRHVMDSVVTAEIIAQAPGVLSGISSARRHARDMELSLVLHRNDGDELSAGAVVALVTGNPFQITRGEQHLLGSLSKTSGIATQASKARQIAGSDIRVVCGGFKKMPSVLKPVIRQAVQDGGLDSRLAGHPFVYLDKNYVRIFGGIKPALDAVAGLPGKVVIQVRGETGPIGDEAVEAAQNGAGIVMVDTGETRDLDQVSAALSGARLREQVEIAFAGEIQLDQLGELSDHDVDAVDIGYAIVDAPCLPMRFDVKSSGQV